MSRNVYAIKYFDKGNTIEVAFSEYSLPHQKPRKLYNLILTLNFLMVKESYENIKWLIISLIHEKVKCLSHLQYFPYLKSIDRIKCPD